MCGARTVVFGAFCSVIIAAAVARSENGREYTDSLAVEIRGGKEEADKLAKRHGFKNLGRVSSCSYAQVESSSPIAILQVGNLKGVYHFIPKFNADRTSSKSLHERISGLREEGEVRAVSY